MTTKQLFMDNLSRLKSEAKVNDDELADAIGVKTQTVSRWRSGSRFPEPSVLDLLSQVFGVPLHEFFAKSGAETVPKEAVWLHVENERLRKELERANYRLNKFLASIPQPSTDMHWV